MSLNTPTLSSSSLSFYTRELETAKEDINKIMLLENELYVERDALATRFEILNAKSEELTNQRSLLKERIHKLKTDCDDFQRRQDDIQSSEIDYFISEDGYSYVDTFEREWIKDHSVHLSGPAHCLNCESFGTIIQDGRMIFLGYCLNCAHHIYNYTRGQGFQGFDNVEDMRTIYKGLVDHLKKYREQLLYYLNKRLEDTNFDVQFPEVISSERVQCEETVSSSVQDDLMPVSITDPINHFDTTECDCDYCDSDNNDCLPESNREYSSDNSDYVCECCHPNENQ